MESIIGIGIIYLIGKQIITNNKLKASKDEKEAHHLNFDDYTRDDYENEFRKFNPDTAKEDIKRFNVILGDHEYYKGKPDIERENLHFDPMNWYNGPNTTHSVTQSFHGALH